MKLGHKKSLLTNTTMNLLLKNKKMIYFSGTFIKHFLHEEVYTDGIWICSTERCFSSTWLSLSRGGS